MSELFTFQEIIKSLKCVSYGEFKGSVNEIVIDSRKAKKGSLFVPLIGEFTDGNLYIESALKLGCQCSLVTKSFFYKEKEKIELYSKKYNAVFFIVDNGLSALHDLARYHIKRFDDLVVVSITGSCGKTTTKEVLGSILKMDRPTLATGGNYNSETGLPLTVFRIRKEHKVAVLEIGMSKPGEIKALVDIIFPDYAIITNIGSAHIGFFDSRDGIAKEKKMSFSNFDGHNSAIIPEWDEYYTFLKKDVNGYVISVNNTPDYISGVRDLGFDGWSFEYEGAKINYPYMGRYNLLNAFIAIRCARELGVKTDSVVKGLEKLPSMFGRGEILSGRNRVIRDCYNANPDSTISSLELLKVTNWEGEKIPILGSMLELGDNSLIEHKKIALFAVANFSKVILLGYEFESIHNELKENSGALFIKDMDELKTVVEEIIDSDSLILLKASRGVGLEEITASLI